MRTKSIYKKILQQNQVMHAILAQTLFKFAKIIPFKYFKRGNTQLIKRLQQIKDLARVSPGGASNQGEISVHNTPLPSDITALQPG